MELFEAKTTYSTRLNIPSFTEQMKGALAAKMWNKLDGFSVRSLAHLTVVTLWLLLMDNSHWQWVRRTSQLIPLINIVALEIRHCSLGEKVTLVNIIKALRRCLCFFFCLRASCRHMWCAWLPRMEHDCHQVDIVGGENMCWKGIPRNNVEFIHIDMLFLRSYLWTWNTFKARHQRTKTWTYHQDVNLKMLHG